MSYFLNRQFGDPFVQFGVPGRGKFGEPTVVDGVVDDTISTICECIVGLTIEISAASVLEDTECVATAELVNVTIEQIRTVRRLDDDGDITTSGVQFLHGLDDITQTIETRLALFLGEYFRDITDGTPWFEQVLGKNTNLNTSAAVLRNRISQTPGVVRLTSFNMDFDLPTRKLTVTASALTRYGLAEITYNG